jgi:cytochrome c-type biogenesis protein CcmE
MKKKKNKTTFSQKTIPTVIGAILIFMAVFTQTACNDSGGGGLLAGGGIGGTGISVGAISGFGSVLVNDVDFDTKNAKVFINGRRVGEGDSDVRNKLALGMVVRVEGKFLGNGAGKADRIVFNENLKGPVTAIETLDTVIKKITVLGQIVIVDDGTNLKGTDFVGLAVGDVLRISGWTDGKGVIQATYAALITEADAEVTARGFITEVDASQKNLRINRLSVDFSQAALSGFPDDELPAVGQLVVARGILDANGVLVAEEVGLESDLGVEDADDVEIEGIVSQVSSPSDFVLGATAVQTDAATTFKGIEPNDIVAGTRLLVKGALTQGRLLADEVMAKDKVNLEGTVESVDNDREEISLRGLNALVIHINSFTKIFGDAAELTDVQQDQHAKILGFVAGGNKVEAARVKVEDKASAKVRLQGPVTRINRPIISVFSVDVDTDAIPENGFGTMEDGPVSRNDFFNLAFKGDTVGANGELTGNEIEWGEIELLQE